MSKKTRKKKNLKDTVVIPNIIYDIKFVRYAYEAPKLKYEIKLNKLEQTFTERYVSRCLRDFIVKSIKHTKLSIIFNITVCIPYDSFKKWTLETSFNNFKNSERFTAGKDFTQLI
uniref:PI3K/PI4K domain-containing protein n=1 Tax=Strongyloides venezuelensis TaxID=75913 RepID=A0A0K0FJ91_STRVS